MSGLLPLEEALATVLENARQLSTERVFLQEALGRVLAEDIPSDTDKPLFDNSAMDGFAVRFEDISGKEKVRLRLVGEVAAGQDSFPKVEKGCAVRIFTGAPVPQGADTVVPVECTHTEGEWVVIEGEFKRGANIRRRGEDVRAGDIVLRKGKEIRGYEIGMLAFVNRSTLRVFRKPRVGILSTGDELLEVGEERTSPSQIRSMPKITLHVGIDSHDT
ncbi:MAG TPA: molybdopterin molybdotransferase MoeA, partial [Aquificaceae bacterium]|nr:molybdopterin molybdotransferase MoeA [Aquificaceae bacterium]